MATQTCFYVHPDPWGRWTHFYSFFSLQLTRIWIGKISHPIVSMELVYLSIFWHEREHTHRKRRYSNPFLQPASFHLVIDRALRSYYNAHLFVPPQKKTCITIWPTTCFPSTLKKKRLLASRWGSFFFCCLFPKCPYLHCIFHLPRNFVEE